MSELLQARARAFVFSRIMEHACAVIRMGAIFIAHPGHELISVPGPVTLCSRFPGEAPCLRRDPGLIPQQAPPDRPGMLRCGHGLVHAVAPVFLRERLAGHLAVGPALLEPPDLEQCERLARRQGYDAEAYLDAIRRIPIVPAEHLQRVLALLSELLAALPEEDATDAGAAGPARAAAEDRCLRAAFDHAGIGLIVVDRQLRCLYANRALARLLGYSVEEMTHLTIFDITGPDEPIVSRDIPLVLSGETASMQIKKRYLRKDGSTVWGDVTVSQLPGDDELLVGVIRDVTAGVRRERIRQVQHELGAALCAPLSLDETLRRVLDAALEISEMECGGIYAVDPMSHAVELRCATGLSDDFLAATARYEPGSESARLIQSGQPLYIDYARLCTAGDPVRLREGLRTIAILPVLHGGTVVACLNIASRNFQDVPTATRESLEILAGQIGAAVERARAEDEILTLNEQLERRVEERTAQLKAANRELEAFAYSVSHDLRAPLRGVNGFSQTLLEDYSDRLDETGREYLRRLRAASLRMSQMIDDILQLSRTTRVEIVREPVDLSALAEQLIAQFREADPQRSVTAVIAPAIVADTDPRLIQRVLANLLDNAWKFTRRRDHARIEFGILTEEEAAAAGHPGARVFFVRDNGEGFDMAHAGKLFGLFQRLHPMDQFPGTGIGLAMVQRILHRLGGAVWPTAARDRGATFHFTLGR